MRQLKILIAGRSKVAVKAIQNILEPIKSYALEVKVITNGHCDPLHGVISEPELLILQHTPDFDELKHTAEVSSVERIPMIVFGPDNDTGAVRLAMRAGASDYLPEPVVKEELLGAVAHIANQLTTERTRGAGTLQVFVNGKGGAGASFLATNVAHGLAMDHHAVTLVDMDLQFAGLRHYLDLHPEHGLIGALQSVDDLDETSANAHTCEHSSGLRLLSAASDEFRLNSDVMPDKLISLLKIYQSINDFVIVDLPRQIDLLNASVLESADKIMVVMQQTLPQVHETARFVHLLRTELGIDESRISLVINRYDKHSPIELKDIKSALKITDLVLIPNQYKLIAESINNALPISGLESRTSIAKSLRYLHGKVGGESAENMSFLQKALPGFLRR